jgi:hypothetical protein
MSKLLEAMSHDDRVDLLKQCDEGTVECLLPLIARPTGRIFVAC